jgi:hypothetical protein
MAILNEDQELLKKFHKELALMTMEKCNAYQERWFDINVHDGICRRRRNPNKMNIFSNINHTDSDPSIQQLAYNNRLKVPEPLSQVKEIMISPVHLLLFTCR